MSCTCGSLSRGVCRSEPHLAHHLERGLSAMRAPSRARAGISRIGGACIRWARRISPGGVLQLGLWLWDAPRSTSSAASPAHSSRSESANRPESSARWPRPAPGQCPAPPSGLLIFRYATAGASSLHLARAAARASPGRLRPFGLPRLGLSACPRSRYLRH